MCDHGCDEEHRVSCPRHSPERGWLQLLFLRLIHEMPMHGYQLMVELNKRGFVKPGSLEAGTVYTVLRRMEHRGLLTSEWAEKASGPDRRVYKVTRGGEELLMQGTEAMLLRKVLIDDLVTYYDGHLRKRVEEK